MKRALLARLFSRSKRKTLPRVLQRLVDAVFPVNASGNSVSRS